MSAQAPLSIRCSEYERIETPSPPTMDEFLRAIWENSWRWESLSLHFQIGTRQLYFLEFTAPQLRDLTIENGDRELGGLFGEYEPGICILKILGNPTLRNLSLNGIGLQWNNLNLPQLRMLSLTNVEEGAPSLEKLMETLKMASGLEHLALHGVDIVSSVEGEELNPQPIHLTSLLSLWLDKLPKGLAHQLIRVIRSPQLKSMRVCGLFPEHLENSTSDQNPYHHFFQVLIPVLSSSAKGLTLSNEPFSSTMYLNTDNWTMPWLANFPAGRTADLGVQIEDPISATPKMVNFITSNRIVVPLTVVANASDDGFGATSSTTSCFLAEVLGKLPMVTKISTQTLADALNILIFLGSIRRDEETGRWGWACPQLKVLNFGGIDGLAHEHYQSFLDARYSDGSPLLIEGEVVHRPPMVEYENSMF
ncbi:hypothetical protein FRC01_011658 [Tulasnella sp. 417]|nr:hypothetical protein FRC01_011658 [Tulasnella sp. 417]